jgi:Na+/glutamate symporter
MSSTNKSNNKELWKYAGLTMQLFAAIGIALFAGYKADQWLNWKFPLLVWLLPVTVIIGTIIKIFKDTASKK